VRSHDLRLGRTCRKSSARRHSAELSTWLSSSRRRPRMTTSARSGTTSQATSRRILSPISSIIRRAIRSTSSSLSGPSPLVVMLPTCSAGGVCAPVCCGGVCGPVSGLGDGTGGAAKAPDADAAGGDGGDERIEGGDGGAENGGGTKGAVGGNGGRSIGCDPTGSHAGGSSGRLNGFSPADSGGTGAANARVGGRALSSRLRCSSGAIASPAHGDTVKPAGACGAAGGNSLKSMSGRAGG